MILFWLIFGLLLVSGSSASAANCNIVSSGISFGAYNPTLKGSVESRARIQVICSGFPGERVSFTLALVRSSENSGIHVLRGQKQNMSYQLFIDPGRTQIWGDGISGTSVIRDTMTLFTNNSTQDYFVYALLGSGTKPVDAGLYTESLVVTLEQ